MLAGQTQLNTEQDSLQQLIAQLRDQNAQASQVAKPAQGGIGGAAIQGGAQLAAGLLQNAAQMQAQKRVAESEAAKMGVQSQEKSIEQANQAQQDAFARLMGSMKSALVR